MGDTMHSQKLAPSKPATGPQLTNTLPEDRAATIATFRSGRSNIGLSLTILLLIGLSASPAASYFYGDATYFEIVLALSVSWLVYQVAYISYRCWGSQSTAYQIISVLDHAIQFSTILFLIFKSGSAASFLWILSMIKACAWTPNHPRVPANIIIAITHAALATAFVFIGGFGDAIFTGLTGLASIIGGTGANKTHAASLRLQAEHSLLQQQLSNTRVNEERERVARQLHDGVGADLTALLLLLRRRSDRPEGQYLRPMTVRAQRALDGLREIVWTLRNERGTLGELSKLLSAKFRRHAPDSIIESNIESQQKRFPIQSGNALAILNFLDELIFSSTEKPKEITVTINQNTSTEIIVEVMPSLKIQATKESRACNTIKELSGQADVTKQTSPHACTRIVATIPLQPQQ